MHKCDLVQEIFSAVISTHGLSTFSLILNLNQYIHVPNQLYGGCVGGATTSEKRNHGMEGTVNKVDFNPGQQSKGESLSVEMAFWPCQQRWHLTRIAAIAITLCHRNQYDGAA